MLISCCIAIVVIALSHIYDCTIIVIVVVIVTSALSDWARPRDFRCLWLLLQMINIYCNVLCDVYLLLYGNCCNRSFTHIYECIIIIVVVKIASALSDWSRPRDFRCLWLSLQMINIYCNVVCDVYLLLYRNCCINSHHIYMSVLLLLLLLQQLVR